MTLPRALAALVALCAGAAPAWAQDEGVLSGTLQVAQARGSIRVGYRESAPPFSFRNGAGQPIGFSVDLCHRIAADLAARLNTTLLEPEAPAWQTGLRIVYRPVAADARLPMLVAGEIDLECGSTTANAERARVVAFSPVFFLAGTKLMVPAGSPVQSYRDLAGQPVVVGAGTTNAPVIAALSPAVQVVTAPGLDAAYDLLAASKAAAFASDDVLLAGFRATRTDGARFRIVGDFLSFEPYAIAFRRDDPALAALVRTSFEHMAAEGALTVLYNQWFVDRLPSGETLNLPMSPQLAAMYTALGQTD